MTSERSRLVAIGVIITAAYVATARLGFGVAFIAEQVTTVWAPTGLAQAALVICGRRLWPAVWLGAFLANLGIDAPVWTAAIIASGNTLEAVAFAWLLPRRVFDPGLSRLSDAARLIGVGALATPAISAICGVTALCAAGVQAWAQYGALLWAWWLGDAIGSLVVAPVILTTLRANGARGWRGSVAMIAVSVAVTQVVFGDTLGPIFSRGPLHYVLFPLVTVAAVRLGQPATALAVLGASAVTIVNTVRGHGPFVLDNVHEGLILLQVFMGVLAGTALLLAGAMTERQTAQRRLNAARAVGDVLVDAADLGAAAPALLRAICERLGWHCGSIWLVGSDGARLECAAVWSAPAPAIERFAHATRQAAFARGQGLPGRVWAEGRAMWIEDVVRDGNFPRAPVAAAAGLHGGFAFPIRLGGELLGVIEFFTDRVVARDANLLEAMSTVGHQVGQFVGRKRVEAAIRASEEDLREAARRKDEFLAMLAHELRNPLAPIRTGLEYLRLSPDDPAAVARIRPMMERQVGHMVRLIDDLLDVSRITSGKIHLQKEAVRVGDLVNGAIDATRAAIERSRAALVIDVADPGAVVSVDPTRVVQILANLLHNAAKFTTATGRITARAQVDGDVLTVSVADTGAGIDPALLPRVFDLFTQGEPAASREPAGLGIGLALARRLVEMHGGTIDVRSDGPGRGSEFVITMPGVAGIQPLAVPDTPPPARSPLNLRVLVVDDNQDAAEMLVWVVRSMGGEPRMAHDGEAAVAAAIEFDPDVILLDVGLPGIDGYEACRRIRDHATGGAIYIVAITGWGQERDKARAAGAGFDAHLTKPADPAVIEQLLIAARRKQGSGAV